MGSEPEVEESIMDVVRKHLSPELLNRIDETVIFNRLQPEHMADIVDIQLEKLKIRAHEGPKLTLNVDDGVKSQLGKLGYNVRYGARPLKRTIQRHVLTDVEKLPLGRQSEGDIVRISVGAEGDTPIVIQKE